MTKPQTFTIPPCPEAPFTGPDGIIWPVPREAMTQREFIIQRMAADCGQLIRDCPKDGWIQSSHLADFGWTYEQIAKHCGIAMTQATIERIDGTTEAAS